MKNIPLTQGEFAIVDDEDFERLSLTRWYFGNHGYAVSCLYLNMDNGICKSKTTLMHRFILGAKHEVHVDHINHNKLDNRRCKLRLCTRSQNNWNQIKTRGTSKYKGVYWDKSRNKWSAKIGRPSVYVGRFNCEEEAALAYNTAALKLFGEFAKLNEIGVL